MIESYHNQLKSFYLTRSRNKRVDRVVYTLVHVVLCDYRTEHVQVEFGLKAMPLTIEQAKRKKKADAIDLSVAQSMVTLSLENDGSTFFCRSFTDEDTLYKVELDGHQKFIEKCNCPDMTYLCKHIFLVSRTQAIPYSDKSAIRRALGPVEVPDIVENEGDFNDILNEQQQQQRLRLDTLSEGYVFLLLNSFFLINILWK
ncbi:unnamed protein product [Mucor hiemalis]